MLGNSLTIKEKVMPISKAQKVRNMLDKGVSPKDIATKLKISPQAVYNIRYQHNKKNGLGSLRVRRPRNKNTIVVPPSGNTTYTVTSGITEAPGHFKETKDVTHKPEPDLYPIWWLALVVFVLVVLLLLFK
jgi:hypothetical protein